MIARFKTLCGCERTMRISTIDWPPPSHYRLPLITEASCEILPPGVMPKLFAIRTREFRLVGMPGGIAEYLECDPPAATT